MSRTLLTVLLSILFTQVADAQTTISANKGDAVTLPCSLLGTFTFPIWRGPPSFLKYTNLDDTTGAINPSAPAASRLQYASNNKDLILSDALISDSGDYKCSHTTFGDYTFTLTVKETTPSPTGPDPECIILAILSAVFGGLAFIILIVLIVAIWKGLGRNFLLVLDGTDIATFTIGIVLGIVVHTYDDCPNWATNLATAVIVISCIGIVCDIISILYIVFGPGVPTEDDLSMTPANTKKKTESFKSFEKEQLRLKIPQDPMNWNETQVEQWLNWAKNEFILESLKVNNFKMPGSELCRMDKEKFLILAQHNKCDILWIHLDTMKKAGKKGASETRTAPRPQPSKPSQGALSDREESDSALSRKDIELQGNFRKMPPIPVTDKAMHDSKGRGLSANFDDDDHPIAGVDTPDRRAGALEPVREKLEPVRGKPKKLKKNKVDEEVMNTNSHNM